MKTTHIGLSLTPADVVMFRDSRSLEQTITGTRSEFPTPRTVAGAIRTWLLRGLGVTDFRKLGPWLISKPGQLWLADEPDADPSPDAAVVSKACGIPEEALWVLRARFYGPLLIQGTELRFHAPLNLVDPSSMEKAPALLPLATDCHIPGWDPPRSNPGAGTPPLTPGHLRPLWRSATDQAPPLTDRWISSMSMSSHILAGFQPLPRANAYRSSSLWVDEYRLGVELNSGSGATVEGQLYAQSFWRMNELERVGLYVELEAFLSPGGTSVESQLQRRIDAQPWLPLGGEGKIARIECSKGRGSPVAFLQDIAALPWPPDGGTFFTYLATPALFDRGGWIPENLFRRFELVGAMTGAPQVISGWDIASNLPQPSRHAVRAGAVYFWKIRDPNDPGEDPHLTCISDDPAHAQEGWGLCLRGTWNA